MLLKGEQLEGDQMSSTCTDDGTATRVCQVQYLEAEEDCQHKSCMQGDAPGLLSTPLEDEQGAQMASDHANEEVHAGSGTTPEDDVASHQDGIILKEDDVPATHTNVLHDPGGSLCRRNHSRKVERERAEWSNGAARDSRVSRRDSATSRTRRNSKRVETAGPPAEAEAHQDPRYMHRQRDDIPEPRTPPARPLKRPVESANPPRRRGRLKTCHERVNRARARAKTHLCKIQPQSRGTWSREANRIHQIHQILTRDAGGAS
ncbi:hypothetical protein BU15DRAFT_76022 [Melanogaster broomeanus]|nr:hypothetical protein BU15DRAFT_76022 [Melanogaster broomeanus]